VGFSSRINLFGVNELLYVAHDDSVTDFLDQT